MPDEDTSLADFQVASSPLTIMVQVPGEVVMYNLNEQELETLSGSGTAFTSLLAGVCAGAFFAFLAVIVAVADSLSDRWYATVVAVVIVTGVLTLFFGAIVFKRERAYDARLSTIKERRRHASQRLAVRKVDAETESAS